MTIVPGTDSPAAPQRPGSAVWIGVVCFLVLAACSLQWYQPAPPHQIELNVVFERGEPSLSEPLIVSGEPGAGDFLFVRYQSETVAVLGYERWGSPPTISPPFDVRPGERRRLLLQLPALYHVRGGSRGGEDEVRASIDGKELLRATTRFNLRKASRVFFAENPIGGGTCRREFSGTIYSHDGRQLHGNARHVFTWRERIVGWLSDGKWQVAVVLLASLGVSWLWRILRSAPAEQTRRAWRKVAALCSVHRWFLITAAVCASAFFVVLTGGTGRLWFEESFGSFFDYQAASLLHGRLDVPEPAVSGEAFIVDGKYYGYFGITPALLRLPFVIFDVGFGWLSRSYMLVEFLGALTAAYAVLLAVLRRIAPTKAAPTPWMVVIFTLNAGLGSTLFFLSSRAYIYHEATLCGAMFALAASACALRYLAQPRLRWAAWGIVFGLLSLHARPPAGLFALVLVACAAVAVAAQAWFCREGSVMPALRRALAVAIVCALGVLSFNGLSYLKFKTFDGAPLKYHVQYHEDRIARIEGKNFHLSNFPYDFSAYVWRPNFELRPTFPYFYITGKDPSIYPNAKIDLAEPTLALPYAMPALVFLAVVGCMVAVARWPQLRLPAAVLAVSIVPMAAALFTAVAISQRYTTDFCPWLISLAAVGLMAAEAAGKSWRRVFVSLVAPLTAIAMFVTVAITLHYQGTGVWGVPKDVTDRYRTLRQKADSLFGITNHEL